METDHTPVPIPDRVRAALDSKTLAHVSTIDRDGTPQASAMWVMTDGDRILLNTAKGRRKYFNMKRDPRIAISISPETDGYENHSIQGAVVDMRESDGIEVIDALANKYHGHERYQGLKPGMVRVTIVVEPTRIASYG